MLTRIKNRLKNIFKKIPFLPIPETERPCRTGIAIHQWEGQQILGNESFPVRYVLVGNAEGKFFELCMCRLKDPYWHLSCRRLGSRGQRVRCPRTKYPLTQQQAQVALPCLNNVCQKVHD